MRSSVLVLCVCAGCQREAVAQVTREPTAPVRCFVIADAAQLSEQSAIELCSGAINDAPGRCYATGVAQLPQVSTTKVQLLCRAATSLEPLACYTQLAANGTLTEDQMIGYCTTRCPLGPPPAQASSGDCLDAAPEQTNLSLQSAGELCAGATSAQPVGCFVAGLDLQKVADSNLITLCRERVSCQF